MAVIGLKYLAVAPIDTETDGAAPTYTAGMKVGHMMKADLSWNRGDVSLYGDNVEVEHDNTITSGQLTVGTTYLSVAARQMLLGEIPFGTPASGAVQEYATVDEPAPYVGVGYVTKDSADGGDPVFTGWWYYKCQFGMDESAETRGESTAYQTPEMVGRILAVRPNSDLKNTFRLFATFDTEAAAIAWVKGKAGIQ